MKNQKSSSLANEFRTRWERRFLIKRIGEEDIEISESQRNEILGALESGTRFVQVGEYTIMLNSIKSIDPRYEPDNVPPQKYRQRPKKSDFQRPARLGDGFGYVFDNEGFRRAVTEYEVWKEMFGVKKLKSGERGREQ